MESGSGSEGMAYPTVRGLGKNSRRGSGNVRRFPSASTDGALDGQMDGALSGRTTTMEGSAGSSGSTDTTRTSPGRPGDAGGDAGSPYQCATPAQDSPSAASNSRTATSMLSTVRNSVLGIVAMLPTPTGPAGATGEQPGSEGGPDAGGGGDRPRARRSLREQEGHLPTFGTEEAALEGERAGYPVFGGRDPQQEDDLDDFGVDESEDGHPAEVDASDESRRQSLPDRAVIAARQLAESLSTGVSVMGSTIRDSLPQDGALGFLGSSGTPASSSSSKPPQAVRERKAPRSKPTPNDESDQASDSSETWGERARNGLEDAENDAATMQSMFAQTAVSATAREDEDGATPRHARRQGRNAVVSAETNQMVVGGGTSLDMLIEEARKPFGQLLIETPDAKHLLEAHGTEVDNLSDPGSADAPPEHILQMLVRDRLIAHVLGCCDHVASELSREESKLWNLFVGQDVPLQGTLSVRDSDLRQVLSSFAPTPEIIDVWVDSLNERANGDSEIDFADMLDWFVNERENHEKWTLQSTLRTGFSQLFNTSGPADSAPPRLLPERQAELRQRCAESALMDLAEAAASYQRSMILTQCWRCERDLKRLLEPVLAGVRSGDGIHGRPPGPIPAHLAILRAIHAELAPSERVLWELLGSKDSNFDGAMLQSEVLAAINELYSYAMGPENDATATQHEFEELKRLRAESQRASVFQLFGEGTKKTVNLADVLKWWWDMPEEYRIAAGLAVPLELLRKGIKRQPEEMFQAALRRIATDATAAKFSLRGQVRVFAELRALCVRRAIENITFTPPTDTRTTTTSEADLTSMPGDGHEDEDEEEEDEER